MITLYTANDVRAEYNRIMAVIALAGVRPKQATCTVATWDVPPVTLKGRRAVDQFEEAFVHGMAGIYVTDSWTLSLNGVLLAHLRRVGNGIELTLHDDLLLENSVRAYK